MSKCKKEIKCIVWDLDNTLWEGILLEDNNVKLKPGVRKIIQDLDCRGILNSIASKNNFEEVKEKLNEFDLYEYFIYPEVNWNSKSSSIKKISQNLNIGLDTILFLDDQDYELDEVKSELEEVTCINSMKYLELLSYKRLNPKFITEDSKRRRLLYLEDIQRQSDEEEYEGPTENFLKSLDMKLYINEAEEHDLKRAQELTVRTNQLNATGITYSYDELNEFKNSSTHKLYICELVDKYGSYGKIGLALVEIHENWHLKLMLMSCRVMSRGLGTTLVNFIMQKAKEHSDILYADFKSTNKNRQMFVTFKFANFKEVECDDQGKILFVNNLEHIQECPPFIKIICDRKKGE